MPSCSAMARMPGGTSGSASTSLKWRAPRSSSRVWNSPVCADGNMPSRRSRTWPWCAARCTRPSSPIRRMPCSLLANRRSQLSRIFSNTGTHVGDRAADHAQHVGGRGLVLERLAELGGALLDLALEAGVRLAQLARPCWLNCSARPSSSSPVLHLDAAVEIARADPRRAFLQRTQRPHQRAGKEEARRHRASSRPPTSSSEAAAIARRAARTPRRAATRRTRSSSACGSRACAANTSSPVRSRATTGRAGVAARSAATCGSVLRSDFFSTRLMSGCAISVPVESTT